MKILLASDTYYPTVNGASYFTQRLAENLAKKGHGVSVIAPSQKFKNTITNQNGVTVYGIYSIPVFVYPKLRIPPFFLAKKAIKKALRQINPDIIHIQNHFIIGKALVNEAKKLNIPLVGTNHFMPENIIPHLHLPKFVKERIKNFGWREFIKVFEKLDVVTTPTQSAADLLKKNGFKEKIIVISNGIDLKKFNPKNNGLYLKKRFGIAKNVPVILFVGRMDKEKNIDVILKAIPSVKNTIDCLLVLAGTGKEYSTLKNLARELGIEKNVIFTGFVPNEDLPNLYALADIFIAPGIAELQGLSAMEAMATGLPIIAVNAIALPELVRDGENGYLFPIGESSILSNRVVKILRDKKLKQQMGEKSLEIIQEHDIAKTIEKFENIYRDLIQKYEKRKI